MYLVVLKFIYLFNLVKNLRKKKGDKKGAYLNMRDISKF